MSEHAHFTELFVTAQYAPAKWVCSGSQCAEDVIELKVKSMPTQSGRANFQQTEGSYILGSCFPLSLCYKNVNDFKPSRSIPTIRSVSAT